MNGEAFHSLSAFYINLWQYINTYFDDNRWLQMPASDASKEDRYKLLGKSFDSLKRHEIDDSLAKQVKLDFTMVNRLRDEFEQRDRHPGKDWFKRADNLRVYSQELGLRYAELSTEGH